MPKAKILPPKIPRGERPSVTIANQANEIRNLIARVQTLVAERDGARTASQDISASLRDAQTKLNAEIQFNKHQAHMLEECQAKLASTESMFAGYRMSVKDITG